MKNVLLLLLLLLCSCSKKPSLKVAASATPHAVMLEMIKEELPDLKIIVVDDYNLPNRMLQEGEVEANFFQHLPFLEEQKKEFGYKLKVLAKVHLEPMGIYSEHAAPFTGACVTIPSDPTNEARALQLMEKEGWIELKSHTSCATVLDISVNPYNLKIIEIDAPLLPRTLEEVDFAIIPGNLALQAGLCPIKDALFLEGAESPYVNVLVVREGEEKREELQKLAELLTSEKMQRFVEEKFCNNLFIVN